MGDELLGRQSAVAEAHALLPLLEEGGNVRRNPRSHGFVRTQTAVQPCFRCGRRH